MISPWRAGARECGTKVALTRNHGRPKTSKGNQTMNNIKRISLMTAIFLTVALVSSAVEAGVIRINGTIAGSESGAPFPNPAEGIYVNGSVMSTDTALGPFTLFYSLPVDFAFADTPPGNAGGSRLIVGDAANGDSILACFLGIKRWFMRQRRSSHCGSLDHYRRNGPVRWC